MNEGGMVRTRTERTDTERGLAFCPAWFASLLKMGLFATRTQQAGQ